MKKATILLSFILLTLSAHCTAQLFEMGLSAGAYTTNNFSPSGPNTSTLPVRLKGGLIGPAASLRTSFNISRFVQAGLCFDLFQGLKTKFQALYGTQVVKGTFMLSRYEFIPAIELSARTPGQNRYLYAGGSVGFALNDVDKSFAWGAQAGYAFFTSEHFGLFLSIAARHVSNYFLISNRSGSITRDLRCTGYIFPLTVGIRGR